ncbi:MAG: hypothetical protein PWP37_779 [Thermotogota bacterium]|nr:hypothetical protein [Thermotogota bacterium]
MVIFVLLTIVWMLIIGDAGFLEILIGIGISIVVARSIELPVGFLEFCRSIPRFFIAMAKAYIESFQLLLNPGWHEEYRVVSKRFDSSWESVMEVFEVTVTPRKILVDMEEDGYLEHVLEEVKKDGS